jgi:hypothetical protein
MRVVFSGTKFAIGRPLLPMFKTNRCPPFDWVHVNFLASLIKTKNANLRAVTASWSDLRSPIAMYSGTPPGPMMLPASTPGLSLLKYHAHRPYRRSARFSTTRLCGPDSQIVSLLYPVRRNAGLDDCQMR